MSLPGPRPAFRLRTRWLPWLAAFSLAIAIFFLLQSAYLRPYPLRLSGGDILGRRHQLAKLLAEEGRNRGLRITVRETEGSVDALRQLRAGTLDVALIQGGQASAPGGRLVAALNIEPLHLLVKREYGGKGLEALRGRRLNLSTSGSGTRQLALQTLGFAGMLPGRDFQDEDLPYAALETRRYESLPDGVFIVSTMPSPVAEFLVGRHGYRFMPLPFGEALALRDSAIVPATIPAYGYRVTPPIPAAEVPTVGNRLLLVAREDVPSLPVQRLLEAVFQTEFLHRAHLPTPNETDILRAPEMPVHPGATDYQNRNNPFLTAALVQSLESLRSFMVSVAIALFFLLRWMRRRRFRGFNEYIAEVTDLEKRALAQEVAPFLDLKALITIRNRLSAIKTEALEKFALGHLRGEEMMTGFLAHVADVRNYVTSLILHERERIAEQASDTVPDGEQEARFQAGWTQAVGVPEDWKWRDAPSDVPPEPSTPAV